MARTTFLIVIVIWALWAQLLPPDSTSAWAEEPEPTPYAADATSASLIPLLKWYAEHSVGSLAPDQVLDCSPRTFVDADGKNIPEDSIIQKLIARGLWTQGEKVARNLIIRQPYRRDVWWSGRQGASDEFFVSPYEYEILKIDKIAEGQRGSIPVVHVDFTWRVKEITTAITVLREIGWSPRDGLSWSDRWALLQRNVGVSSRHSIEIDRGIYGYYLPIVREPNL